MAPHRSYGVTSVSGQARLRVDLDRGLKPEFHDSNIANDAGPAYIAHPLRSPVGRSPNHVWVFQTIFCYHAMSWSKPRRVVPTVEWQGRYNTFQMAEVAIPGPLLAEILRLIDGVRRALFATMTGLDPDSSGPPGGEARLRACPDAPSQHGIDGAPAVQLPRRSRKIRRSPCNAPIGTEIAAHSPSCYHSRRVRGVIRAVSDRRIRREAMTPAPHRGLTSTQWLGREQPRLVL